MKKLSDFFLGPDGDMSSKRLLTFLLVLFLLVYMCVNLFYGRVLRASLEEFLFYTIWGFFFGVAADRWRGNKTTNNNQASGTEQGGERPPKPPVNP